MLESIRYDVRHAVRGLLRDRAFTVVALLSIGLGVGANSAIFPRSTRRSTGGFRSASPTAWSSWTGKAPSSEAVGGAAT